MYEKMIANVTVEYEDDGDGEFYVPLLFLGSKEIFHVDGISFTCLSEANIDAYVWVEQYGREIPLCTVSGSALESAKYRQVKVNLVGPFQLHVILESASAGRNYSFTLWGWYECPVD